MKVILAPFECEPSVKLECECGCQFWTDPSTEENLSWDGSELFPICPKCKKVEKNFYEN